MASHRAELVKTLEADDGRIELRAVTGPDYGRIWDHELVEAVMRTLKRRKKAIELSPLALEAVRRIGRVFDIEREITGTSIDNRLAVRREHAAPLVAELEAWMRENRAKLSRHDPSQGDGLYAQGLGRVYPLPR